jgi:hypothetical protein
VRKNILNDEHIKFIKDFYKERPLAVNGDLLEALTGNFVGLKLSRPMLNKL